MLSVHALQESPNGGEIALQAAQLEILTLFCSAHLLNPKPYRCLPL